MRKRRHEEESYVNGNRKVQAASTAMVICISWMFSARIVYNNPAARKSLCSLASSAYARASLCVCSGLLSSIGITYSPLGSPTCPSPSPSSASSPKMSVWKIVVPLLREAFSPPLNRRVLAAPGNSAMEKPSPARRTFNRPNIELGAAEGVDAGAGMDEEGEEARIPRSQRLTRQKLSSDVNRMNQPGEIANQHMHK
jgi:hypothetical protein